MIFFGLSLCALLTFAFVYDGDYIECFDHVDCQNNYEDDDKIYCYAGTCTDRCPPGHKQINTEEDWNFICECDEEKGFIVDEYFEYPFANLSIPKCKCNKNYCHVTVHSTGIGYTDGLIPKGAPPNCKIKVKHIPGVLTQFSFYLVLISMILFMVIHCRSSSSVVYDFHRYYLLYVLGSTMVIVFVQTVTPFTAGFTRTMAFGIVAHNSAEWNLLLRLQFGKTAPVRTITNIVLLMYYVIMLLAMSILPLHYLLYFSMVQGGFLDWTFVCMICAARKAVHDSEPFYNILNICNTEYPRFVFWFGNAAIIHLVSVEILFAGFILNDAVMIGLGGFFLLPMFLLYTIWVLGQTGFMVFCGPRLIVNYVKSSAPRKFLLEPINHTSRVVDVLYKRYIGYEQGPSQRSHKVGVEMESLDVQPDKVGKFKQAELADVDESASVQNLNNESKVKFEVQDPELFKFGFYDEVVKCPCVKCCCLPDGIPFYWVVALILIAMNAALMILLPLISPAKGCNEGFDYGAW